MKKLLIAVLLGLSSIALAHRFGCGDICGEPCGAPACPPAPCESAAAIPTCTRTVYDTKTIRVPRKEVVPAVSYRVPQAPEVVWERGCRKKVLYYKPVYCEQEMPATCRLIRRPDIIKYCCPVNTDQNPGCEQPAPIASCDAGCA